MRNSIYSLQELHQIAYQKRGNCLSKDYHNSKEKLLWQCEKGHLWYATAFSIKIRESWCPYCARNVPLGIAYAESLAQQYGGTCLSSEYKNCKTNLMWSCSFGHQFEKTLECVKLGRWCPMCKQTH